MSTIIILLAILPKTVSMQPQSLLSSFVTVSADGFLFPFTLWNINFGFAKELLKSVHILRIVPSNYFRAHKAHIYESLRENGFVFKFGRSVGLFALKDHFSFGTTRKKENICSVNALIYCVNMKLCFSNSSQNIR